MSRKGIMFLALVITVAISLLYVRSRFLLIELSYAVSKAQDLKAKLEQEKRSMILELATLKDPKRIELLASEYFGLDRQRSSKSIIIAKKEVPYEAP